VVGVGGRGVGGGMEKEVNESDAQVELTEQGTGTRKEKEGKEYRKWTKRIKRII
jgi:hypothetical protein